MANVKLTHEQSKRTVEVPEESAGPYRAAGWQETKGAVQKNSPKAAAKTKGESEG